MDNEWTDYYENKERKVGERRQESEKAGIVMVVFLSLCSLVLAVSALRVVLWLVGL